MTRQTWKWSLWRAVPLLFLFLSFDIPFFVANLFKFRDGGYIPVLVAVAVTLVMVNWNKGHTIYKAQLARLSPSLETFLQGLDESVNARVPGAAIFLSSPSEEIPLVLVRHVERIHTLPETVILLSVITCHEPHVPRDAVTLDSVGKGIYRMTITRGFRDSSRLLPALVLAKRKFDLDIDLRTVTYFFGRETFIVSSRGEMSGIAEALFAFLARNACTTTAHYKITPHQVVELGVEIDL